MSVLQSKVTETEAQLFEAASLLLHAVGKENFTLVSIYARLFSVTQLQRVAQELYQAGRHTLALEVANQADKLKD